MVSIQWIVPRAFYTHQNLRTLHGFGLLKLIFRTLFVFFAKNLICDVPEATLVSRDKQ